MEIVVLNGSPKGDLSVTMQYVHFVQKKFPQHGLKILNVAQRIKAIEKDESLFRKIVDAIGAAEGVLWAFPVYFLLVPSGYKRFIELIRERGFDGAFKDKYSASLSTSIHFYDHIAHNYINAISDDLDMKYVGGFSPDMYDLLKEKERKRLILFASHFFETIEQKMHTPKNFGALVQSAFEYVPGNEKRKIATGNKKVCVLTDLNDTKANLTRMVQHFSGVFHENLDVINLNEVDIKGGCQGCIQCAYDGRCFYDDKDGYAEFFNTRVKGADVLVFVGSITDRYLSSRWKLFFDRSFFNNHAPVLTGKQIGFIVSGPLRQVPNLRQALEAFCEIQQANVIDFITDECENSTEIDALLENLAERLIRFSEEGYVKPAGFLGVGGRKIFRDDIYGRLRFPFRADHYYYKRNGLYDFPQRDYKTRARNAMMMLLTRIPSMRKEIYTRRIKKEMVKPLEKLLDRD
ncbi:NAD(P)H-dependent oxidoreductase [Desulfatiglans anilini]|uniref:NAD(P)H-dependent oxidoreductase n=1 Tax=Desulfatiglans anilini TaxID=90728 RepID=UPI00047F19B4|nr:NAD(P)H-dependent oxidoreductase [Desulfatiglans anilini]